MSTEHFIALLKKELLGQTSPQESSRLKELAQAEEDYAAFYQEILLDYPQEKDNAETEAAYLLHLARMKKKKLL